MFYCTGEVKLQKTLHKRDEYGKSKERILLCLDIAKKKKRFLNQ